MSLTAEELACCSDLGGIPSNYNSYCQNIPVSSGGGVLGISFDPCNYDVAQVEQEVEASNPFNWGALNSLLSTLGTIAVPFLPFLFDDGTTPPAGGGVDNTQQIKSQNGMVLLVGFAILIALSVGAYLIIKKRR
jgi:hypothetical protein